MSEALKFGLIGRNITYSKSRDIFEAIYQVAGVDGTFDLISIEAEQLRETIDVLSDRGYGGLSVTIPYKQTMIGLLDAVDPVALAIGAVNSVHLDGHAKKGYNTDCDGFAGSLEEHVDSIRDGRALILGNGGAARAVTRSLAVDFSMREIVVVGRTADRLDLFKNSIDKIGGMARVRTSMPDDVCDDEGYDIVVNCTPLGGWNHPDLSPLPSGFDWSAARIYYDLNYNSDNKVVEAASVNGLLVLDGWRMLILQAAKSFEIWTGIVPDRGRVFEALTRA